MPTQPTGLLITAAGATSRGYQRRQNEDAFRIYQTQRSVQRAGRGAIFAVADGVGGTGAGKHASWHVVDNLSHFFTVRDAHFNASNALKSIIKTCDERLQSIAKKNKDWTMAATTLSLLHTTPDTTRAFVVSIGDSAVYVLHKGRWLRLSEDHRNRRGKVTSAVGLGVPKISVRKVKLQPRDVYLLCTDGIRDLVDRPTLRRMLEAWEHPAVVAQRIVDAANEAGGLDNSTAIVVRIGACPEPPPADDD